MKLLLFGRDGQVGWELQRALAPLGEVVALNRNGNDDLCGDLADVKGIAQAVRRTRPDVIVNAAAYTAVDKAEAEPDLARAINVDAPAVLASVAREQDAWLVHYSTDYVFDGSGNKPWHESDTARPLNVYGHTKLEGEEAIRHSGCVHLVLRTSWVHAARARNFIRTMLRFACERDSLQVIDDQFGAPTGAELIADVTAHALMSMSRNPASGGLYHLAARGETTWYGYARFLIDRARALGWPIRVQDDAVAGLASEAFAGAAARPRNSRLDCARLEHVFELRMPAWQDGVDRVLAELATRQARGGQPG